MCKIKVEARYLWKHGGWGCGGGPGGYSKIKGVFVVLFKIGPHASLDINGGPMEAFEAQAPQRQGRRLLKHKLEGQLWRGWGLFIL